MATKFKTKASTPLSIDIENRTMEVVMSTRSVDRDGDIVEPKGIDLKNYLENPVVLWAHNSSMPPIAKVLDVTQEADHLRGTVQFAKTEMAEEIFQLYVGGFLKTWSIGFGVKELEPMEDEQSKYVKGYHIKASELYELSAVPVPANPEALVRACKSLKDEELKKTLFEAADYEEKREAGTFTVEDGQVAFDSEAKDGFKCWKSAEGIISDSAFTKSFKEAGAKGKIPVVVGEIPRTEIYFEVIKREGDRVTEAKVKNISISLSRKEVAAPLTPQEPSRIAATKEAPITEEATKAMEALIRDRAKMRMVLLEAGQFC